VAPILNKKQFLFFFENDQVKSIQGDFKPSAIPVTKPSTDKMVDVPKRNLEKTMQETITDLF